MADERLPGATLIDGTIDDLPPETYDAIVYIGLAEYLGELELLRHLDCLRRRLSTAGRLIISTTDEHPQRQFMSEVLGWHTRSRSPGALSELLDTAGFLVESQTSDPNGIQWVMSARLR